MSDGTYCIIRDLGLVKGGKGMRHFECLLRLTFKGVCSKLVEVFGYVARRAGDLRVGERPMSELPLALKRDGADRLGIQR